LIAHYFINS
jgi:hypothetical protein